MTADRFEILLNQRLILRDLHGYIDGKIRRIHGRRVADLLHELLKRREEETQSALDGLRLQYPGYAEEIERRFIRRTSLRLEEREYDILYQDGLIGRELYTTLKQEIADKRKSAEARPALDLAVQKSELVRQFPLFADMDDESRASLARALRARYVQPGEVLMRRGDIPREVCFIASGAVEVETAGQKHKLGRGEMFGQLALLSRQTRRTQVTASATRPCWCPERSRRSRIAQEWRLLRHGDPATCGSLRKKPANFRRNGGWRHQVPSRVGYRLPTRGPDPAPSLRRLCSEGRAPD
jgi:monovalent cation:H+ antiporter, CPA1 family